MYIYKSASGATVKSAPRRFARSNDAKFMVRQIELFHQTHTQPIYVEANLKVLQLCGIV